MIVMVLLLCLCPEPTEITAASTKLHFEEKITLSEENCANIHSNSRSVCSQTSAVLLSTSLYSVTNVQQNQPITDLDSDRLSYQLAS